MNPKEKQNAVSSMKFTGCENVRNFNENIESDFDILTVEQSHFEIHNGLKFYCFMRASRFRVCIYLFGCFEHHRYHSGEMKSFDVKTKKKQKMIQHNRWQQTWVFAGCVLLLLLLCMCKICSHWPRNSWTNFHLEQKFMWFMNGQTWN